MEGLTEAPMSLGERFRAAREQRALALSDVAEQIHIRSVYLAAIEEENWGAIGAPVYIRGFIRTYARFLGIDPEDAVAQFNAAAAPSEPSPSERGGGRSAQPRSLGPLLWLASLVALALIGFVVYLYLAPPRTPSVAGRPSPLLAPPLPGTPQAAATPEVVGSPGAGEGGPAPLAAARTLAIHLTAPSWLRVSVDGNVSIEGTFPAGTTKTFHGKVALVRVGNAGGVEITVDGKPLGPLGGPGDVVEKSFTL